MRKKRILLLTLIICLICGLTGCKKEEAQTEETINNINTGIYIGEANKETNFIPKLTLIDEENFEFCVTKTFTYNGQYHIDNNRLILTISEEQSYTFSQEKDNLILNEQIGKDIPKKTKFHLWGAFDTKKTPSEKSEELTEKPETEETKEQTK